MATRTMPALEFPPSDPEYERALGQFIIAWGQLEAQIDGAIDELFDVTEPLEGVLTANLGTKAKLDIFHAAIYELAPSWKDDSLLEYANRLVTDTSTASSHYRTRYAHGQPTLAEGEDGAEVWVWIKRAARKKGLSWEMTLMIEEASDFARYTATDLIVRWHEMRGVIAHYKSGGAAIR